MTACKYLLPPHPTPINYTYTEPTHPHSYKVTGWGTTPDHQTSNPWHITANLARIADQPPIGQALAIPMADQLDDWKDYLRLKIMDRGKDFAFLREIVSSPLTADPSDEVAAAAAAGGVRNNIDNNGGYFSRRGSKTIMNTDGGEDGDDGYYSRRGSRFKLSETATPTVKEEEGEEATEAENEGDPGYFSRQGSARTNTSL